MLVSYLEAWDSSAKHLSSSTLRRTVPLVLCSSELLIFRNNDHFLLSTADNLRGFTRKAGAALFFLARKAKLVISAWSNTQTLSHEATRPKAAERWRSMFRSQTTCGCGTENTARPTTIALNKSYQECRMQTVPYTPVSRAASRGNSVLARISRSSSQGFFYSQNGKRDRVCPDPRRLWACSPYR